MEQKETRGRKHKDVSFSAQKRRKKARERFHTYFDSLGITQAEMADICGLQLRQVQRILAAAKCNDFNRGLNYEDIGVSNKVAKKLEKHSGIVAEYWTGETDEKKPEEYMKQCQDTTRDKQELEIIEKHMRDKYAGAVSDYESLFSVCGYQYECLADTSSLRDIWIVLSEESEGITSAEAMHRLTAFKDPSKRYLFTQDKFITMVQHLRETIAFECFRNSVN